MEDTGLLRPNSSEDERAKVRTYRIRGIPNGLDKIGAKSLLLAALKTYDVIIDSLAAQA